MRNTIGQKRVRAELRYDESTGIFKWRKGRRGVTAGAVAGYTSTGGVIRIGIANKEYSAHQLEWLYVHGVTGTIKHRNGDLGDNRLSNPRCDKLIQLRKLEESPGRGVLPVPNFKYN